MAACRINLVIHGKGVETLLLLLYDEHRTCQRIRRSGDHWAEDQGNRLSGSRAQATVNRQL